MEMQWKEEKLAFSVDKILKAIEESELNSTLERGDYFSLEEANEDFIVLCSLDEEPAVITVEKDNTFVCIGMRKEDEIVVEKFVKLLAS